MKTEINMSPSAQAVRSAPRAACDVASGSVGSRQGAQETCAGVYVRRDGVRGDSAVDSRHRYENDEAAGGGMKKRGPWISKTSERNRGSSHSILTSSKK